MADITRIRTLAQAGWSQRRIARELGHDRGTIKRYVESGEPEPDPPPSNDGAGGVEAGVDSKPANVIAGNRGGRSVCEPHREVIEALLEKGLTAERVFRDLRGEHDFAHSYPTVARFVRKLKKTQPKRVWRMECEPGEEAQSLP